MLPWSMKLPQPSTKPYPAARHALCDWQNFYGSLINLLLLFNIPEQVSLDAAWGPYDVDGRNYDWVALANAVDIFFVMVYDTRSQIYDHCLASANSPLRSACEKRTRDVFQRP